MAAAELAIKVDVDTDRGTAEGVPRLAALCRRLAVPATFLFSLGPDHTGRALRRAFRPGFLAKALRTDVAGTYGLRTLLRGTVLPAPHIGRRHAGVMRAVRDLGFEVGIHGYDHVRWQDRVHRMTLEEIRSEFRRAVDEFERIFAARPAVAGAPGWQCNERSLAVYDEAGLAYASDARGRGPFRPAVGERVFATLQIPSTLPTLDELLGRPEYPVDRIVPHYLGRLGPGERHVLTVHAEIEGQRHAALFEALLVRARDAGVRFFSLSAWAAELGGGREAVPACRLLAEPIDGRHGTVATQGPALA